MRRIWKLAAPALTLSLIGGSAQAATILNINLVIDGAIPSGDTLVVTMLFEDVAANQVKLTTTASLNAASEFIGDIGFNVSSGFVPSSIVFSNYTVILGPFNQPTLTAGAQNAQNPNGASSGYDFTWAFATSNAGGGVQRFNNSDSFSYILTATGLTAADFNAAQTDGYHAFAHVQGIGALSSSIVDNTPNNQQVPAVPEPGTLLLVGAGLLAAARKGRRLLG